jgi:SPOR domain
MAQSTQRLVLDLDEIERQLKQTQLQSPLSKSDPLAELARIVGQNDPFKSLLGSEQQGGPAARFDDESLFASAGPRGASHPAYGSAPAPLSPADRIEAGYAYPAQDYGPADVPYDAPLHELQPHERRRSRRGLLTVAIVLGTAVVAVSGALMLRNRPVATVNGEPPIIKAESDPLKIKPENPGGMEIANQTAQVYERSGPDKQTRVVNREEQPVDVQQAARAAQPSASAPAIVPPSPGPMTSAPNNAVASLGEPRRVRTVTVRPSDGAILSPDQPAGTSQAPIVPPAAARPAQPSAPQAAANGATPAPAAAPSAPWQPPRADQRANGPSTTATPSAPPAPARQPTANAAPQSAPPAIAPSASQQAAAPQRTATIAPAAAPRAADAAETTSAAGGFAVQLSVAATEEAARSQAQTLRRKYADELGGRSPLVRTAEVNGKTLYRIRVGPMSKEDANELCTKLKGTGGDKACFVAKN